jgi:hypothetical protein
MLNQECKPVQALQSTVRAEIEHDLEDARDLLEQAGTVDDGKRYRKAAEIVLLKVLRLDADNEDAKSLLQSIRSSSAFPERVAPRQLAPQPSEEIAFVVAAPALFENKPKKKKRIAMKLPVVLVAFVVAGGGFLLHVQSRPASPTALAARAENTEAAGYTTFQPRPQESQDLASSTENAIAADAHLVASSPTTIVTPPMTVTAALAPEAMAPTSTGRLAVSSPTVAEIYMGERYLGSTPTTVQLPAGRQTVEYRHGDLRTVAQHDIKANETTTAAVTFQVTVQVNAKPWAQVFLDGDSRRALGQTPLSGVTVPIGGVLVFENPNFTTKSHRISDKDSAIQVDFP